MVRRQFAGQQMMEQEEVDLIAMMNGSAIDTILNGNAPFDIVWNEAICEGGVRLACTDGMSQSKAP
jgi:hypothetical protein